MTQQDLIKLVGLKISNPQIIAHFDVLGLRQPKYETNNSGGPHINHKEKNTYYSFGKDVYHEACYPPSKEGKPAKWVTYLKSITLFNSDDIHKKGDIKEASFWNVTPPPTATLAEIEAYFGKPVQISEKHDNIRFSKKINNLVEIYCSVSLQRQAMSLLEVRVSEEHELIAHYIFIDYPEGSSDIHSSGAADQNAQWMLVKWLHDSKQLNVGQNVNLNATKQDILAFVHQYLKGKLWQNQLTNQDRQFVYFVSDAMHVEDEKGDKLILWHKKTLLKAIGKLDEYNGFETRYDALDAAGKETGEFYWVLQEVLLKSIPVNAENYALFAKEMNASLAHYNDLMKSEVNRKAHYLN